MRHALRHQAAALANRQTSRPVSTMASQPVRRSHIEVERKFVPTALLQALLDGKYGECERLRRLQPGANVERQPSAPIFFRLPDIGLEDKYIDYKDKLSSQGIWMRHRVTRTLRTAAFPYVNDSAPTAAWEAKLRIGGDRTSTQMLEARGAADLKHICALYMPDVELGLLAATARLRTLRRTFVVQKLDREGEIRVVVDEVAAVGEKERTFRHEVGEVEMTAEVVGGESDAEHDVLRRGEVERLQARLDEFVGRHAVVFPEEGVKGKLEAYFEWKEKQRKAGAFV